MYAIVKCGGKQYRVVEGDILDVDKLSKEAKEVFAITEILAISDGKKLVTSKELKDTAKVTAEVILEARDKKVIIYKKRRRKDSKLKRGFRRSFTKIRITKIEA